MKCVFRVDSSVDIGTGHIMRCRALAFNLQKRGADIRFITRAHHGHLGDMLARDGFEVVLLPQPNNLEIKEDVYATWLGVSQEDDALQTICALENQVCDWIIVDHYGLDSIWEELLNPYARNLMVIDDLANRNHVCDLLLDQNYAVSRDQRYRHRVLEHCQTLLGPRYALLRSEYTQYRKVTERRTQEIKRILVFMGGSDNANTTGKVLAALTKDQFAHLEVDVVIGTNYLYKLEVTNQANARPNTRIHGLRPHLADLMVDADLAIGAGGATIWERFCIGVPSLVISIAENQVPTCKALASKGLIQYLGNDCDLNIAAIEFALSNALSKPVQIDNLAASNQLLVDGLGASRVAEVLIPTQAKNLMLRLAKDTDAFAYFSLVSDLLSESNNNETASTNLSARLEWFNTKLTNKKCFLYLLEANGLPIGQLQFDADEDDATINYSLDTLVQGRGWEENLLKLGIRAINSSRPSHLDDLVESKSIKSSPRFVSYGFVEQSIKIAATRFSIAIISDENSWVNDWLPEMIGDLLKSGHRVLWVNRVSALMPADFCFYISFGKIVPKKIRSLFTNNLVVHESDLPKGKGWSPLTWQILEGKNNITVSLIEAEDNVDSGVIYSQEQIEFKGHELIHELRRDQMKATIKLCKNFINNREMMTKQARQQKGEESFYSRRQPLDSVLDVNKSLADNFNILRVADNLKYPAYFKYLGVKYEIQIRKSILKNGADNV